MRAPIANAPTDPSRRVGSIDALRGLALFGVLAINLETEFRVSIFRQLLPSAPYPGWDGIVDAALNLFVDMKAFALFSFLFGVGPGPIEWLWRALMYGHAPAFRKARLRFSSPTSV